MRPAFIIAMAALGAAAYVLYQRGTGEQGVDTAGDIAANFIEDGIDMISGTVTSWPTGAAPYRQPIEAAAAAHGVPVLILAWLLWKESRYNPAIITGAKRSPVGAMGIAQFMPATAREELGSEAAALDPYRAIPGSARYLKKLYNALGTWEKALAAYNWGIGNVQRKGLERAPAETRNYYKTIMTSATGAKYA